MPRAGASTAIRPPFVAAAAIVDAASATGCCCVEGTFRRPGRSRRPRHGLAPVDGVVLDIGVSSMQLDEPERGFSFQARRPARHAHVAQRADRGRRRQRHRRGAISRASLFHLGEERRSRAIARAIVAGGARSAVHTTARARRARRTRARPGAESDGRHPATRTSRRLRIYVNDELGELARGAQRGRAHA